MRCVLALLLGSDPPPVGVKVKSRANARVRQRTQRKIATGKPRDDSVGVPVGELDEVEGHEWVCGAAEQ